MNYTENYHLPQWVQSDRIMMDDFNASMFSIEEGLTDNKASADSGIAQARAEAAALPYAVGSYTGNGAETQDITLGFRPRFVIICQHMISVTEAHTAGRIAMAGARTNQSRIEFTDTGFRVSFGENLSYYPQINLPNTAYDYIAFR